MPKTPLPFSFPPYLGNWWYYLWLDSSPVLSKHCLKFLEINNKNFQKETFSKGMLRESAVYRMIKRHMFRINFCQKTSAIDSYHLHHHCFHDHNRITKWIKAIECVTLWDGRHSNMALQHLQLHKQVYCFWKGRFNLPKYSFGEYLNFKKIIWGNILKNSAEEF